MRYAICLAVLLSGCTTPNKLWTQGPVQTQEDAAKERAQLIVAKYGPLCEGLGYQRDSDPWRQCVIGRYDADRRDTRARQSGSTSCTVLAGGHMVCN